MVIGMGHTSISVRNEGRISYPPGKVRDLGPGKESGIVEAPQSRDTCAIRVWGGQKVYLDEEGGMKENTRTRKLLSSGSGLSVSR